ncbi:Ig-like domain-containing protein [Streptomyces sp. NPDC049954]|uniref:L,D-transpeptidase n=1 Tax=Streptomyces sp. NPDC049954 TaxID=3155779 RepID=UPI0034231749
MSHSPRTRTVLSCTVLVAALGVGATACGDSGGHPLAGRPYDAAGQVAFNAPSGSKEADPDKPLEIVSKGGESRITDVSATDSLGRHLAGALSADGARWHSTSPLAANAQYTVRVSTENSDGDPGRKTLEMRTGDGGKKRLKVSFGPEKGTYGVGQPLTATLSAPVKDKASRAVVERSLSVESTPAVQGSWYWVDSKNLHYRPKTYWPARSKVRLSSNLDGVKVTGDLRGGPSEPLTLGFGDRIEAVVDSANHDMTVRRNGKVVESFPVTTGKPGFDTRNGIKVILGKESFVRMRSGSVGIAAGSSESYDLPVYWATRVTWSGEYVHAAPWSVGSQGSANTSHGCVGMSTENAHRFFDTVQRGDIVEVVGSDGERMTPFDNGFGDWNLSWKKWQEGSAIRGSGHNTAPGAVEPARLRPGV